MGKINGDDTRNVLAGDAAADRINGRGGNDHLFGRGGRDYVTGGSDNDWIFGEDDDDRLYGNNGDDWIFGGIGIDRIHGGRGHDWLFGEAGDDIVRAGGGNDLVNGGAGADDMHGGAGHDTVDYSDAAGPVAVNLGTGAVAVDDYREVQGRSALDGDAVDTLISFESAVGSQSSDLLAGSDGANTLFGLDGNDIIVGRGGADELRGGSEVGVADMFSYWSVADSTPEAADTIQDFGVNDTDIVDLSVIDANATTEENDAFDFIEGAAFSGTAGELRYDPVAGLLQGDVNGDAVADLEIRVSSDGPLTATNLWV